MKTAAEIRAHILAGYAATLDVVAKLVESPIEELMFWALLQAIDEDGRVSPWDCWGPLFSSAEDPKINGLTVEQFAPGSSLHLWPQMVLAGDTNYRLDFALIETRHESGALPFVKIAIECDGHDFHEKTKEQARRDKKRDRYLQTEGWLVARFTGSEIVKDPVGCATQVMAMLTAQEERLGVKLGEKP